MSTAIHRPVFLVTQFCPERIPSQLRSRLPVLLATVRHCVFRLKRVIDLPGPNYAVSSINNASSLFLSCRSLFL